MSFVTLGCEKGVRRQQPSVSSKFRTTSNRPQGELQRKIYSTNAYFALRSSLMSLVSRIALQGDTRDEPEDFFASSLSVIFPDDVTNQHGDANHALIYTSPYLSQPILLELDDPTDAEERYLFSHYLWNAGLLLAELIEQDTLGLPAFPTKNGSSCGNGGNGEKGPFHVEGLSVAEVGAGTALPSIMAALLGAEKLLVMDYPAEGVVRTLNANVSRNIKSDVAPEWRSVPVTREVEVKGHAWGEFDEDMEVLRGSYDRVVSCDCLWMPWQHENLRRSISYFLKEDQEARAWVVAGFHTGRAKLKGFFDREGLLAERLEVEKIWERDCAGKERQWDEEREEEDKTVRKRWLVVAVLKRVGAS